MARFAQKGITKVWFSTTNTTPLTPKASEITGANGIDLTPQLSDLAGFSFSNNPVDTPDMSQALITKIPGEDAIDDSSMTFYEDKLANPIKTKLAKGVIGWVFMFGTGIAGASPASGDIVDVWPCQVSSNARQYNAGNEASKYLVKFAPTAAPSIALTCSV